MLYLVHSKGPLNGRSFRLLGLLWLAVATQTGCHTAKVGVASTADNAKVKISLQKRQEWTFNNGRIKINNRFASARANDVSQVNDSTFKVDVLPENEPVNPSPWYAFKVWSATSRNIYFTLNYPTTKHRYNPKQSADGKHWQDLPVTISTNEHQASFKVTVGRDTLTLAAQEVISSAMSYAWMDSLASANASITRQRVGTSLMGKPIYMLTTKGSDGKKLVVVLSRQHPPEVTGYMAMQEFVRTVTGNSALAESFRQQYELVLFPMLNPDGVDEGNWRHSAAGVDLNRDWENFEQPETQSVKQAMTRMIDQQNARVYFALDFHSTYYDIFYINQLADPASSNAPGFTLKWLGAMKNAIQGFNPNIKPSGNGGNVSKSWFSRVLGAEALTYEVGDNTARPQLLQKGRVAAEEMMKLLLQQK
ncbi:M14 family metallopeptidase [Mucilaginibacter daejeonensis]|uniref:M14 family metallopeptidase n=1 Tax=Mucilaginibacter daejeonensis TaxID=398049 RepID=UPI001D177977|nr:M14 family metallopeptidase [Mucilaginibacter daejeonensis]UEG52182.1 M14 family metallopeptidase [Mucilaginibacter daejeonensis]